MNKPPFGGGGPQPQPPALDPANKSTPYPFIAPNRERIGAPKPRRNHLGWKKKAAPGIPPGLGNPLGQDPRLTNGVPLGAPPPLGQIPGGNAHKIGHFPPGFGKGVPYIIYPPHPWVAPGGQKPHPRDPKPRERAEKPREGPLILAAGRPPKGIRVSRMIPKGLKVLRHGGSCFLLRQKENHPHRYQIKMVGDRGPQTPNKRQNPPGEGVTPNNKESGGGGKLPKNYPENRPPTSGLKKLPCPGG